MSYSFAYRKYSLASQQRQTGVALLTAVLVVAIATILIAAIFMRAERGTALGRNQVGAAQADSYARGLETWAATMLDRDRAQNNVDSRNDLWAQSAPPFKLPNGQMLVSMQDRNGCFDLNALNDRVEAKRNRAAARFQAVLNELKVNVNLVPTIQDWIDADSETRSGGAEDMFYLTRSPPYRTANARMAHVSELRLLKDVDATIFDALQSEVCVLPEPSLLNVNTLSPILIKSLQPGLIDEALAKKVWQGGKARYERVTDFANALKPAVLDSVLQQDLSVQSEYFEAEAQIELDGVLVTQRFLQHRDAQDGAVRTLARWR